MGQMHGDIHWNELMTRDVEGSKAYYGATCGWTWDTMPMSGGGDYHLAMKDGVPVAGMMDMSGMAEEQDSPAMWFTYIAVQDVDAVADAAEGRGAKVETAPFDVPGVGRIMMLRDPGGARVGLMTPAQTQG